MKQLFVTAVRDFETNTMGKVEMREMPMPEPGEEEVRVKVLYSSICGSDTHTLTGHLGEFEEMTKAMLPMTFGHELSGVIDQAGPRAEKLGYHKGDRVVVNYARYCHACDECRSGHENLCQNMEFVMNGFAEYAVYHVSQIFKIPDTMDLKCAALIEPLTIALAVAEQAKISFGKRVAIMGAGGIGLMLVQLARLAGASTVTVFDLVEDKCELAKKLGADYAFDPREEGAVDRAIEAAGGKYECVIEGTGAVSAAETALKLLARNGDGVYFAMYGKDPYLKVNLHNNFYWDQKHLHGVIMGAGLFPKAIRTAPRLNLDAIIQKEVPLSRYTEAFDALYTKKYAKIVLKMDE